MTPKLGQQSHLVAHAGWKRSLQLRLHRRGDFLEINKRLTLRLDVAGIQLVLIEETQRKRQRNEVGGHARA
ncbi:Uncharacterised protein [Burkholderia pseudomallei]|nr:Uncharacterised protein [Burkholderia pseudomallei]